MLDQMVADAQHKKQEEEQHQVGRGQGFEQVFGCKEVPVIRVCTPR